MVNFLLNAKKLTEPFENFEQISQHPYFQHTIIMWQFISSGQTYKYEYVSVTVINDYTV